MITNENDVTGVTDTHKIITKEWGPFSIQYTPMVINNVWIQCRAFMIKLRSDVLMFSYIKIERL